MNPQTNDVRERMQDCARSVEVILPPGTGFVLLAFDTNQKLTRFEYVSNSNRQDVCKALEAFLERSKNPQSWCKIDP